MKRRVGSISKALRWEVFARDGECVLAKIEPDHVCKDIWNQEHAPNDFDRLTLEHVHREGRMMGRRAPSDARHLIALDGFANFSVPSKVQREAFRAYLEVVAP